METLNNYTNNISFEPNQIGKPRTLAELLNIVQTARESGLAVRAVGKAWSQADVAYPSDYLITMRELKGILAFSQGDQSWGHQIPNYNRDLRSDESSVLIEMLHEDVVQTDRRFIHVLSGTSIREMYLAMDSPSFYKDEPFVAKPGDNRPGRAPWMFYTKPSVGLQTIGGAISTGSHGGDFNERPLADSVRAIQIVAPDGQFHWIEPNDGTGITDPDKMRTLAGSVSTLTAVERMHFDTDLFRSALVSIGNMGVIASVIMEVREQYGISEGSVETTWGDLKPSLESGEIFTSTRYSTANRSARWIEWNSHSAESDRSPRGLGVAINLYRQDDDYSGSNESDRRCQLATQCESANYAPAAYELTTDPHQPHTFLAAIRHFEMGGSSNAREAIDTMIGLWTPTDTNGYFKSYTVWDPVNARVHGQPPGPVVFVGQEIAVTTRDNKHIKCVDAILEKFDELVRDITETGTGIKFAGAAFLRFSRPSNAFLGMEQSDDQERFCHIEIFVMKEVDALAGVHSGHHNMENFSEYFFKGFEQISIDFDSRMHWGQLFKLNRWRVERSFPDTLFPWRKSLTKLPGLTKESDKLADFSSSFSKRCGLESNTEVIAAVSDKPDHYRIFRYLNSGDLQHSYYSHSRGWQRKILKNNFPSEERFTGPITACSWGSNRFDIFGQGRTSQILQVWSANGSDFNFTDLTKRYGIGSDVNLIGPMATCSPSPGRIELFATIRGGRVFRIWFDDGWHQAILGNRFPNHERFVGSITAVSDGNGRIHLFGLGKNGQILHLSNLYDGSRENWRWYDLSSSPELQGISFAGPISASSSDQNRIDIFGNSGRYRINHCVFDGEWRFAGKHKPEFENITKRFGLPEDHGKIPHVDNTYKFELLKEKERFLGPLSAVASGSNQHLFGIGENGYLLQMWRPNQRTDWNWSSGLFPARVYVPNPGS